MSNKLYEENSVQAIADAIRSVNGSTDTYKIGDMAAAVAGISTGLNWSELNYDTTGPNKGTPQEVIDAFNYAKQIMNTYNVNSVYTGDKNLFFWPNIDISERAVYNAMFDGSNLLHTESLTLGKEVPESIETAVGTSWMFRSTLIDKITINVVNNTNYLAGGLLMFANCLRLKTVTINSKAKGSLLTMFQGCSKLETINGAFDTSECTDFKQMFENCISLVTGPTLDTSSGENFYRMFNGCTALTTAPAFDLSSATDLRQMFWGCPLVTVPVYDLSSATNLTNMFQSTGTDINAASCDNILQSCISATAYTGTKKLTTLGLSSSLPWSECAHYSEFTTAGWTIS